MNEKMLFNAFVKVLLHLATAKVQQECVDFGIISAKKTFLVVVNVSMLVLSCVYTVYLQNLRGFEKGGDKQCVYRRLC